MKSLNGGKIEFLFKNNVASQLAVNIKQCILTNAVDTSLRTK